ncbi:MAG: glucose-6-phosphate isomerase, partial [Bacteroidales bacterium]|nr:glucose-6-phosphate isomerase [Bacteroidales bacterium]
TTEPAIAFRLLRNALENKYGKQEAKARIVAITDESKGALRQMCIENGYESFVIKDDIGGRFSVLSPVGLFPSAVAGVDVEELLYGAKIMRERLMNDSSLSNPSWKYAAIRNLLYRNGKKIEALVSYEPALQYFAYWWQQLYGESEGKEGKGLFPVGISNTTDLHSLGQYIQEGERLMFETVLHVEKSKRSIAIPFEENDLDGLNYLTKYSLLQINHIAEQGTRKAHLDGEVSQLTISLESLNERELGGLIYFFEFACALSAYVLGVNPFDQPGVEAYKRNMFELLGKKK